MLLNTQSLNWLAKQRIELALMTLYSRKELPPLQILIWMGKEDSIVHFRRRECLDSARVSKETAVSIIGNSWLRFGPRVHLAISPSFLPPRR